jgi:hypothetical protein
LSIVTPFGHNANFEKVGIIDKVYFLCPTNQIGSGGTSESVTIDEGIIDSGRMYSTCGGVATSRG